MVYDVWLTCVVFVFTFAPNTLHLPFAFCLLSCAGIFLQRHRLAVSFCSTIYTRFSVCFIFGIIYFTVWFGLFSSLSLSIHVNNLKLCFICLLSSDGIN